jgi:putative glutathione S-transferase
MKANESPTRELEREPMRFTDRITADARDGWPVESGRYRLVISRACPWAHRVVIVRRLMGLDDAISLDRRATTARSRPCSRVWTRWRPG